MRGGAELQRDDRVSPVPVCRRGEQSNSGASRECRFQVCPAAAPRGGLSEDTDGGRAGEPPYVPGRFEREFRQQASDYCGQRQFAGADRPAAISAIPTTGQGRFRNSRRT